ncbi:MAG: 2Fe-2S iron-sulfur cluster binding domain-containing protein [Candidatus Latescibacteria bacterium]|nr:2Fe-2S iron-sulfur cluster binding domain-containing protein [Candidatus Latescibacterota bacterium]
MSKTLTIILDGEAVAVEPGDTILEAAERAGAYIPRLCAHPELKPFGSCRVCTVVADGRPCAACTQPVAEGMVVENDSEPVNNMRRDLIEMLFVEGNHFCMFCEKSGQCELQALAYRFGMTAPKYPYMFPQRDVDASHPEIVLDRNRCVLCARCVRASRDLDGKHVFDFVGRGADKRLAVNAHARLADTDLEAADRAVDVCPVGAILRKRTGYATPIGDRLYDLEPIGSENGKE